MTSKSARLRVLNSLLFIRDASTRNVPDIDGNSAIWSTTSCVAVSCVPDSDGETHVTIGAAQEVAQHGVPLFDSKLETPTRSVVVETVIRERILERKVPNLKTRVRIWTDGYRDTRWVIIGLG
jgi:hypothetical protein